MRDQLSAVLTCVADLSVIAIVSLSYDWKLLLDLCLNFFRMFTYEYFQAFNESIFRATIQENVYSNCLHKTNSKAIIQSF